MPHLGKVCIGVQVGKRVLILDKRSIEGRLDECFSMPEHTIPTLKSSGRTYHIAIPILCHETLSCWPALCRS